MRLVSMTILLFVIAAGSAMVFNGVANAFYTTKYQHKEDCLSHDTWPAARDVPLRAAGATASELFELVRDQIDGDGELTISLERDLVVSIECAACGSSRRVMKPRQVVAMGEATCRECGELARPEMVHVVEQGSPLADERLTDLGIPAYDVVRITCGEEEGAFKLSGDREAAIGRPGDAA